MNGTSIVAATAAANLSHFTSTALDVRCNLEKRINQLKAFNYCNVSYKTQHVSAIRFIQYCSQLAALKIKSLI